MGYQSLKDEREYEAAKAEEHVWQSARELGVSRRRFLGILGGLGAAAALGACAPAAPAAPEPQTPAAPPPAEPAPAQGTVPAAEPPKPKPIFKATPDDLFIVHGSNAEMRWEAMHGRGYVTPNEMFFVRNHSSVPDIDLSTWRLQVSGSGVTRPLEVSYDDLLAMPSVSVLRSVECAGNGRSYYDKVLGQKAKGTQWLLGAIGVAEWTGVPLREVLERAGVKQTARDVMPVGMDELKVRRPMSAAKALEEDTLLVYAMNGQPLPPDHGFPVRVLTPGWIGVANVKWVGGIEVSEEPLYSDWNTTSYVLIGPDYQPQGQAKGPVLSNQALKSALELAWPARITPGPRTVRGRSWSPFGKITRVDCSLDGGQSWQAARLEEPNLARAWVRWTFPWDAQPGEYGIRVRATDEKGNTQPDSVPFNEQGYLYNAVVNHPVTVG